MTHLFIFRSCVFLVYLQLKRQWHLNIIMNILKLSRYNLIITSCGGATTLFHIICYGHHLSLACCEHQISSFSSTVWLPFPFLYFPVSISDNITVYLLAKGHYSTYTKKDIVNPPELPYTLLFFLKCSPTVQKNLSPGTSSCDATCGEVWSMFCTLHSVMHTILFNLFHFTENINIIKSI